MSFFRPYLRGIGFRKSRNFFSGAIVFVVVTFFNLALSDIGRPPSLVTPTQPKLILHASKNVTMQCEAHGRPDPRLTWFKDGIELTDNIPGLLTIDIGNGTLRINTAALKTGTFHCLVSNEHGALVSPSYTLLESSTHVESKPDSKQVSKRVGDELTLPCGEASSNSPSSFVWMNFWDGKGDKVELGGRRWVDDKGSLHFSCVSMEDNHQKPYKCFLKNNISDMDQGMGEYELDVTFNGTSGVPRNRPTSVMFKTESPLVVLEGETINLKCIFSGYPLPTISWSGPGINSHLRSSANKYDIDIMDADASKNGTYFCEGSNEWGPKVKMEIEVVLKAAPRFRNIYDGPHDRNVTVDDEVVVNCSAHADPPANVTWYRNGKVMTDLPENYHLSSDRRRLTVTDVCKFCDDRESDLTVVQCKSTNLYGTLWGSGYINVLERTTIDTSPKDVSISPSTTHLTFNCSGTSDESTPVTIRWYKNGEKDVPLKARGDVSLTPDNGTLTIRPLSAAGLRARAGNYSCVITNGYSTDVRNFTVVLEEPIALPSMMKSAEGGGTAIGVVLILLSFLLMLAFLVYRNRRCATYLVDEKERENGNEPEKELESNGFLAYSRPERKSAQGSHLSLISSGISYGNTSLSEYGDTEACKYDEDGSFIGNYGVEAK